MAEGVGAGDGPLGAVDLERYPIHELTSRARRALVSRCRAELETDGVCVLDGFVRSAAVSTMIGLARALAPLAWASDQRHTVYFEPLDGGADPGDPRRVQVRSAKRGIAYDHIPDHAPLGRLYRSDELTRFLAAVLAKPVLYRSADPLDAFQITTFEPGDELGWHFDRSEFSVTVMYQPAEAGGVFEFHPGLRRADDECYGSVARVLAGDSTGVRTLTPTPGTLAVFHGQCALHRVTPVAGGRPRINSVLTYGEGDEMRLNDLTSVLFYGRSSTPGVGAGPGVGS